jgi:hypothetical protein
MIFWSNEAVAWESFRLNLGREASPVGGAPGLSTAQGKSGILMDVHSV